jgi:hypothetical protein
LERTVAGPQRGLYDQEFGYTAALIKTMQPSVPPFLAAIIGVFAAMIFMSPFVHWLALVQTSLAKHGGVFLGPAKRRLLPTAPFVVLFHPVPYLTVALIVISVLVVSGWFTRVWWWFLGGFYLYVACVSLLVLSWHAPLSVGDAEKNSKLIWPFDVIVRRRYERQYRRQYRAACALFLVQCSFAKLSTGKQADVIQRVRTLLLLLGMNIYVVPPNSPSLTFIFAAQMKALGIPPALDGEPWPLPEKFVLPVLKPNPIGVWVPRRVSSLLWKGLYLSNVYRRGGKPVEAARAAMIARGLDVNGSDVWHEWPVGGKLRQGT